MRFLSMILSLAMVACGSGGPFAAGDGKKPDHPTNQGASDSDADASPDKLTPIPPGLDPKPLISNVFRADEHCSVSLDDVDSMSCADRDIEVAHLPNDTSLLLAHHVESINIYSYNCPAFEQPIVGQRVSNGLFDETQLSYREHSRLLIRPREEQVAIGVCRLDLIYQIALPRINALGNLVEETLVSANESTLRDVEAYLKQKLDEVATLRATLPQLPSAMDKNFKAFETFATARHQALRQVVYEHGALTDFATVKAMICDNGEGFTIEPLIRLPANQITGKRCRVDIDVNEGLQTDGWHLVAGVNAEYQAVRIESVEGRFQVTFDVTTPQAPLLQLVGSFRDLDDTDRRFSGSHDLQVLPLEELHASFSEPIFVGNDRGHWQPAPTSSTVRKRISPDGTIWTRHFEALIYRIDYDLPEGIELFANGELNWLNTRITSSDTLYPNCMVEQVARVHAKGPVSGSGSLTLRVRPGTFDREQEDCKTLWDGWQTSQRKVQVSYQIQSELLPRTIAIDSLALAEEIAVPSEAFALISDASHVFTNLTITNPHPYPLINSVISLELTCKDDRPGRAPAASYYFDTNSGKPQISILSGSLFAAGSTVTITREALLASVRDADADDGIKECAQDLTMTNYALHTLGNGVDRKIWLEDLGKLVTLPL